MDENLLRAVSEFVQLFDLVFHDDWDFSRNIMICDPNFIAPTGTFIAPGVEDEDNNWANRGSLLKSYRELTALLQPYDLPNIFESDRSEEAEPSAKVKPTGPESVRIDLKNPFDFTEANVGMLLASREDDKEHSQLCVTKDGFAYLRDSSKEDRDSLLFRVETWVAGNGYVGPEAAADEVWRKKVFKLLQDNWPKPAGTYIDVY